MKKVIISICILVLLGILIIILLPKNNGINYEKYVNEIKSKESILENMDNFYNPKDGIMLNENVSGLLDVALYDFDNDEETEILVTRVKENDIVLSLYRVEDNKLKETDKIVLFEDYLDFSDEISFNCFLKKNENDVFLYAESLESSSLIADGITWKFRKLGFNKDRFFDIAKKEFSGSYFDEDYLSEEKDFVKETGLVIDKFAFEENGKSLYEQNRKNSYKLFDIIREHLSGFSSVDYYDSNETKVKYGVTKFKSYNKEILDLANSLKEE